MGFEELADELKEKASEKNNNSLLVLGDFDITENDFPPYIVGVFCSVLFLFYSFIYFIIIFIFIYLFILFYFIFILFISMILFAVNEFPTLLLFPARDKLNPIKCGDTQSIQKIRRFLKEHVPV
jgi:hypothetical protein